MQLYVLDEDPEAAAKAACDRHVVKICTEAGQLLTAALHHKGVQTRWKPSHKHSGLAKWTRNRSHATWVLRYGLALCAEYTARYGRVHKTEGYLRELDLAPLDDLPWEGFLQVVPEEFQGPDPVEAYRKYYRGERIRKFATWKGTAPPAWYAV